MMKVHLLEARTGDSFIVECGEQAFIVDGGTRSVAKKLKRYLEDANNPKVSAIFVTHVDTDHIGGILKLFSDFSNSLDKDIPIYMNHPDLVYLSEDDGLVSYSEGTDFKNLLIENNYKIYQVTDQDTLSFGDVSIDVVSPSIDLKDRLYNEWRKADKPKSDIDDMVSNDPIIVDCSIESEDFIKTESSDIVNASSLCFVISYKEKNALFLSDSHPNTISNVIQAGSQFDLVKISHHGSKFNTTKNLLDKIKCQNFIISTNGPVSYGHPDPTCLEKIINSCVRNGFDGCILHFNYKSVLDRIKIINQPTGFNISALHTKLVEVD